jgi:hypothetical protein
MPEQFERIADYARQSGRVGGAERIRTLGTRRIRRRRAGQVVLGAGAFALVTGVAAALAVAAPSHPGVGVGAGVGAASSTVAPSPHPASGKAPVAVTSPSPTAHSPSAAGKAGGLNTDPYPASSNAALSPDAKVVLSAAGNHTFNASTPGLSGYPNIFGLGSSGIDVSQCLSRLGFVVQLRNATSATVPAGQVSAIEDAQGDSVLGRTINPATPLIVVVSSGPSS